MLPNMMIFVVVILAFMMFILFQFLTSFPPGRKRREDELKKLKEEITPWFSELIAWNEDELEMLSMNQINQKKSTGLRPTGKGIFTSIYSEPMVAYAYTRFQGKGNQAIVYAKTANHEYAFGIKARETNIWMDGQPIGTLQQNGVFMSPDGKTELARIKKSNDQKLLPVYMSDREVASLIHPDQLKDVNPRTFDLVKKMSKEEEGLVLALALNQMVKMELKR